MELPRPSGSASLNSLSNELILMILRNFCLHCRQGPYPPPHAYFPSTGQQRHELSWYYRDIFALHSMSLVSRQFYPLAQEILYHEFIPGYGDSPESLGGYDWDWRFAPFLRTVALNPCRAASVKRLHVNFGLLRCEPETFTPAEEALKEAARARGVGLSEFRRPFRHIETEPPVRLPDQYRFVGDEMLGMLLACLPNLRTLSLMASTPFQGTPASALRAAGVSSLPIETLDIRCCDPSTEALGGILELASSSLRNLYINLCDGDGLRILTRHGPFRNSKTSASTTAGFI